MLSVIVEKKYFYNNCIQTLLQQQLKPFQLKTTQNLANATIRNYQIKLEQEAQNY